MLSVSCVLPVKQQKLQCLAATISLPAAAYKRTKISLKTSTADNALSLREGSPVVEDQLFVEIDKPIEPTVSVRLMLRVSVGNGRYNNYV